MQTLSVQHHGAYTNSIITPLNTIGILSLTNPLWTSWWFHHIFATVDPHYHLGKNFDGGQPLPVIFPTPLDLLFQVLDCLHWLRKMSSNFTSLEISELFSTTPRLSASTCIFSFFFSTYVSVVPKFTFVRFLGLTSMCCPPNIDYSPTSVDESYSFLVG